jgi:hypothetical protein
MATTSAATPSYGQTPAPEPAAPASDAIEEARAHLRRANAHFDAGEFKEALAEFEDAYQSAPNYRILYNIGLVNLQLNRYAAALVALERYLEDGGDEIDGERRENVIAELSQLRKKTGILSVASNVQGAEVRVDGQVVGVTPLGGLRLDAGTHSVILLGKDGRSTIGTATVRGGEESRITLELAVLPPRPEPLPPPAPLPVAEPRVVAPKPAPRDDSLGPGVWAMWGITGAFTIAAVGTGVAALVAQRDHEEAVDARPVQGDLHETADKALALSIATDVLIGLALASGGVSLYLTLTADEAEPKVDAALGAGGGTLRVAF